MTGGLEERIRAARAARLARLDATFDFDAGLSEIYAAVAGSAGADAEWAARPRRWPLKLELGLTTAATAAAVTLATLVVSWSGRETSPERPASAAQIMNVTADAALREPAAGPYWRLSSRQGNQFWVKGRGGALYVIEWTLTYDTWARLKGAPRFCHEYGEAGVRTVTAADQEAWRRAGAPGSWLIGRNFRIRAASPPAQRGCDPLVPGNALVLAGKNTSYDDLQRLPADPIRLREALLRFGSGKDDPAHLFRAARSVLTLPVPPAVRAAAYRLIGSLPGVRVVGTTRDPLGRPGEALAMRTGEWVTVGKEKGHEISEFESRLIVDPATGRLLATQKVTLGGTRQLVDYTAYEAAGWTDTAPELPATPQRRPDRK